LDLGPCQIDIREVCFGEIGPADICFIQVRPRHVGDVEIGLPKIGLREDRPAQTRQSKVCAPQEGT
jgi:hypothetical protein